MGNGLRIILEPIVEDFTSLIDLKRQWDCVLSECGLPCNGIEKPLERRGFFYKGDGIASQTLVLDGQEVLKEYRISEVREDALSLRELRFN